MSKQSKIDESFRKKLENFEKDPPTMIWDGINKEISGRKRNKAFVFFLKAAAGIAILAVLGLGTYYIGRDSYNKIFISSLNDEKEEQQKSGQQEISEPHVKSRQREEANGKPDESSKSDRYPGPEKQPGKMTAADELPGSRKKESVPNEKADNEYQLTETDNTQSRATIRQQNKPDLQKEINNGIQKDNTGLYNKIDKNIVADLEEAQQKQNLSEHSTGDETFRGKFSLSELPRQTELSEPDDKIVIALENSKYIPHEIIFPTEEDFNESTQKPPKYSLTAMMSPILSYRDISETSAYSQKFFNDAEIAKISYSGGVQFGINASSRLSIQTGVVYSRMAVGIENLYSLAMVGDKGTDTDFAEPETNIFMISNSIGTIKEENNHKGYLSSNNSSISREYSGNESDLIYKPSNITSSADAVINQYFHFLELPLILKYKIIDRSVDMNILGGLSTNLLLKNDVYLKTHEEKQHIGTTANVRSLNYSGNFGLGFDYGISDSFLFSVEPQFKYYLNSLNEDATIISRPYSFGFYTGIRYIF